MATINLNGRTNAGTTCSSNSGITISGYGLTDIVNFKEIVGTYTAWSAWPDVPNCTNPAGCPIGVYNGWLNSVFVCANGSQTEYGSSGLCFPTPSDAKAAWDLLYPNGVNLIGATAYTFFIKDSLPTDNQGGLSLEYTVIPGAVNAIMFSCNT